jgi:hypothetical protein
MISRLPTQVQIALNRKLLQSSNSLYPGFPVYLTTIGGRLSFINFILPPTTTINQVIVMVINGNCLITVYKFIEWIIIFSKNVLFFLISYIINIT